MTTDSAVDATTTGAIPEWTLGWRLQRALAHAGIRAEDIAEEVGVARTTVSRWMHDKGAPPRTIYLRHWALRTGVPFEWIAFGAVPDGSRGFETDQYRAGSPSGADASSLAEVVRLRNRAVASGNGSSSPRRGQTDARVTRSRHDRDGNNGCAA